MQNNIRILICMWLFFLLFSCDSPSIQSVKNAFLKDNPTSEIIALKPVEGDSSTVYFEIRYREKGEEKEQKEVWQYFKNDDGKWVLNSKTADP